MPPQMILEYAGRRYRLAIDDFGRVAYDAYVPDWHRHAVYHLILISAGSCYVEFNRRKLLLETGTMLFINPLVRHRFSSVPQVVCEHTTILWRLVDGRGNSATFPLQRLYPGAPEADFLLCRLTPEESARIRERHQQMLNRLRERRPEPLTLLFTGIWISFFDLVMRRRETAEQTPYGQLREEIDFLLEEAIPDPDFSLRKLAAILDKSPNYLNARFRQATGDSIGEALRRKRFRKAAQLLTGSRLAVGEIAAACGFRYANHFSRAFARYCGVPPLEFRRQGNALPGFFRTEEQRRVGTPEEVASDGVRRRTERDF